MQEKILLADDDADCTQSIGLLLEQAGAEHKACTNGAAASWYGKIRKFDLIVSELQVPYVDGVKLLSTIRKVKANKETPFLFLTDSLDPEGLKKLETFGQTHLIGKQDGNEALLARIEELIGSPIKDSYVDAPLAKVLISSVREILNFYFKENASIGKPSSKMPNKLVSGTVGCMNFSSKNVRGSIRIFLTHDFLDLFAAKLFGESEDLDPEAEVDVSSEFCNQIMGKIKLHSLELGFRISVTLPKVIHFSNPVDYRPGVESLLNIPVTIGGADLTIDCVMEKT